MFIKTESEGLYRQYVEQSINSAYSDRSKELKTRAEVIQGDQDFQTEDVFENPKDTVAYHKAKTAAGKYVNFLIENTSAAQSILSIQNTDHSVSHHLVNVATLALATELKIFDDKQKQILTLGCLLHDFGHFDKGVINIIYQHEELVNGEGPLWLREKDQDPLAVVASTANALDRILLYEGQDHSKALKSF